MTILDVFALIVLIVLVAAAVVTWIILGTGKQIPQFYDIHFTYSPDDYSC